MGNEHARSRRSLRVGAVVALVVGVGSCHWPAMGHVSEAPSDAIGVAPTRERAATSVHERPRARATRAAIQRRPRVAEVPAAERDASRSPAPIPTPRVRTPSLDCTPHEEVGYRRGKASSLTAIRIDGDLVETSTASAYWAMYAAAAKEGLRLRIYSGFRTADEQAWFYRCYQCGCCNGGVLAAKPGWSNYQSGRALDLEVSSPGVLTWLKANASRFGFTDTVRSEPWHWEYGGKPRFDPVCPVET